MCCIHYNLPIPKHKLLISLQENQLDSKIT
nr:MAG TPA: hypothetical protein [Bacteriophage sp.]